MDLFKNKKTGSEITHRCGIAVASRERFKVPRHESKNILRVNPVPVQSDARVCVASVEEGAAPLVLCRRQNMYTQT